MANYRIIAPGGVNQRAFPSTAGTIQTRLVVNTVLQSNEVPLTDPEGRLWLRLAGNTAWQWVCMRDRDGRAYIEEILESPPPARPNGTTNGNTNGTIPTPPSWGNTIYPTGGRVQVVNQPYFAPLIAIDNVTKQWFIVNIRELAWFGSGYAAYNVQRTRPEHIDQHIKRAREVGARVIRFFAPLQFAPLSEAIQRVGVILDKLRDANMLGIVCLNDSIGLANMTIAGESAYHTAELGHLNANYFVRQAWRTHYLPFVEQMVTTYREHPAVFSWQLINEPGLYPQPPQPGQAEAFLSFVQESSALIARLAPKHLISVGLISSAHVGPGTDEFQYARLFYYQLPHVHIVGTHMYQLLGNPDVNALWDQEARSRNDYTAAQELGKAFMVDEFGAAAGDRLAATGQFLNRWLVDRRSASVGQWGFMYPNPPMDIGVGDGVYGFDPILNTAQGSTNAAFFPAMRDLFLARLGF